MVRLDNGQPFFGADTFSAPVPLGKAAALDSQLEGSGPVTSTSPALAPWPGTQASNPYSSDADGNASAEGNYASYDVFLVSEGTVGRSGYMRVRIVVEQPRTADAAVHRVDVLQPFRFMRTPAGDYIYGIERSLTHDGHFMVFQGNPLNTGSTLVTLENIDRIMYSYNPDPEQAGGWSTPKELSRLYYEDRDRVVVGKTLAERYPIARQPLRDADGRAFLADDAYRGAYPWISPEGAEIFHTLLPATRDDGARRTGYSAIGRWTGHAQRQIDGIPNWSLEGKHPFVPGIQNAWVTTMTFAFGATSSIWNPFAEQLDAPVPSMPNGSSYAMFSMAFDEYFEVGFSDFVDGDYQLSWSMNELATRDAAGIPLADLRRTPDTSGNLAHGSLGAGAMFPIEYDNLDERVGLRGQAVHFDRQGTVTASPNAWALDRGLTIELFVKPRLTLDGGQYLSLAVKPGVCSLYLAADNRIYASVNLASGERLELDALGPGTPQGQWSHIALTYQASSGELLVYQNGV